MQGKCHEDPEMAHGLEASVSDEDLEFEELKLSGESGLEDLELRRGTGLTDSELDWSAFRTLEVLEPDLFTILLISTVSVYCKM